ncbi:Sel1 domain-containing protein [Polychytrium aggregatum]|nr:Sel1 domain-containing protein [Polychytrium aggregatum]KAI9199350.1 Sel1 domain-containing protein [Polychytrium aggregatum]
MNRLEAFQWYSKAASQGNSYGLYGIGYLLHRGEGVTEDKAQAVEWLRQSAELGNRYGQYYLGSCYKNGDGVPKINTAVYWYRKAANQGDQEAINCLKSLGKWP